MWERSRVAQPKQEAAGGRSERTLARQQEEEECTAHTRDRVLSMVAA
jgi:hypothetical protein